MSTQSLASQFATVFRGFDPGQVEAALAAVRESAAHAREEFARVQGQLSLVQTERDDLRRKVADSQARLEARTADAAIERDELKVRLTQAQALIEQYRADLETESSFVHLGKRVGQILSLAEAEATALVTNSSSAAAQIREDAAADAERIRRAADQYAVEVQERVESDAEQALLQAMENAATTVDDAVRDAAARREEAQAYVERQRAMAAEAAADFERMLSQRREKAIREFQAQMGAQEEDLRRVAEQVDQMRREGEQERATASGEAAQRLTDARDQAHELVETARTQAERIRRESERELAAAIARRDSITSQLSNVRSMLGTFGLDTGADDDALAAISDMAAFRDQVDQAHRDSEEVAPDEQPTAMPAEATNEASTVEVAPSERTDQTPPEQADPALGIDVAPDVDEAPDIDTAQIVADERVGVR